MKTYKACFYIKKNGCLPFYKIVLATSKSAAIKQAKTIAIESNMRFKSIIETL